MSIPISQFIPLDFVFLKGPFIKGFRKKRQKQNKKQIFDGKYSLCLQNKKPHSFQKLCFLTTMFLIPIKFF